MKTVVLYASPTREMPGGSISTKLAEKFLVEYRKNFPNAEILEFDLNKEEIGIKTLTADKLVTKEFFSEATTKKFIELLKSANHLIVSSPMINFNVPAVLKNFLDHVAVANQTFRYKYDGDGESEGLVTNLTVQILCTQGAPKGWYPFGDHVAYLKGTFEFLGMKVNQPILVDGTKTKSFGQKSVEENLSEYSNQISKAAKF
ncbi:MAG: FMN-dependent NADH-azoreductase [Mycoplasmatales bacterium]|nr:FMN-dependent NADH-azoreductase [Mycoplasmatales bacterium]